MKLFFRQKLFAWADSYDVYDEKENIVYKVKGHITFGHRLSIFDKSDKEVARIVQEGFWFIPTFDLYVNDKLVGHIKRKFLSLLIKYHFDSMGWIIDGNFFDINYKIIDSNNKLIAGVYRQYFRLMDSYVIEYEDKENELLCLLSVIAVDIDKCLRNKH